MPTFKKMLNTVEMCQVASALNVIKVQTKK